jgi:alpha-glucosidase (family GH31 glycosyl hydrolase)
MSPENTIQSWLDRLPADFRPVARPEAVVTGPNVRFTVLAPRLLRLEYSPQAAFEDRASQAFWYRRQPVPAFQVARSPAGIEVSTECLHLHYAPSDRGFAPDTLSIELLGSDTVWHYGDLDRHNLRGTARTLDTIEGSLYLEPGLISRSGWAVVDDSASLVFDNAGWLQARSDPDNIDLYFFGYGHDYAACLQDFFRVAGPVPLVPRWALGNWWSRYWEYSQQELLALMDEFRARDIPLSVCIVDMDWHITDTGNASRGWTGYTWNRDLFPHPGAFLQELHEQGLHASLNLHPADGVHPHEEQYQAMARRMGIDPASREPVPFDIADPRFAAAYFQILHHPQEALGVDFWWIDWQQGKSSSLAGLDPLWWLNHLHFYDLGRDGHKRPFIFSRWGGLGNHRYPIGFSGDTVVSWKSLAFQPYFTATAANVGYGWWSHDIGGHFRGIEDRELYTRWVQYGLFSPVLRLHSTKNPYHERRPWGYDPEVVDITREAMQLRHALVPYLYSMAWQCHAEGRMPVQPMYYQHPEEEAAYLCPNQYYFGSELVAAPYTSPRDPDTRLSRQPLWLPEGDWFDFFSGEYYTGGRWHTCYGRLDEIPVLARAGGIVPLGPRAGWGDLDNPAELTIHLFAGADNEFVLYEDDGETTAYLQGGYCLTPMSQAWHEDRLQFTLGPARGDPSLLPEGRSYQLVIHGVRPPDGVRLAVDGVERAPGHAYDEALERLVVDAVVLKPAEALTLAVEVGSGGLLSGRDRRLEACRKLLAAFRLDSEVKHRIDRDLPTILGDASALAHHSPELKDAHLAALSAILNRGPGATA